MEAIHRSIDHLLYCMSTLWPARPSHSGPKDIRCCYSHRTVHCDTSEAARELKQTPPLSRTNWSFNYWGLFFCVFVRILGSIVLSMRVTYVYYVFFPSFLCRTKFSRCVKKAKQKKCVRKWQWASFIFIFCCWLASQNWQSVLKRSSLRLCFPKCHNVPEYFLKISYVGFLYTATLCLQTIKTIVSVLLMIFLCCFVMDVSAACKR